jgi:hypothetical protein
MMERGAVGTISVTANVLPGKMSEFCARTCAATSIARSTSTCVAADPRDPVLRDESLTDEVGPLRDGPHRPRHPPAAARAVGTAPPGAAGTPRDHWSPLMRILAWTLLLVLAGCSWFNDDKGLIVDRSEDYLKVRPKSAARDPGGLDASRVQDSAPIPTITDAVAAGVLRRQAAAARRHHGSDSRDEVRIQRLGNRPGWPYPRIRPPSGPRSNSFWPRTA